MSHIDSWSDAPVVIHVPHSSTAIPDRLRDQFTITDQQLNDIHEALVDHDTDLIAANLGTVVKFSYSRLLVDVERFWDNNNEPMADIGMGAIYQVDHELRPIRRSLTQHEHNQLKQIYDEHHQALQHAVDQKLKSHGRCLLIDLHSYSAKRQTYEQISEVRPELCIGTDDFHTPPRLADQAGTIAFRRGFRTARNTPFAGTLVPIKHHQANPLVMSLMLEWRRDLYRPRHTTDQALLNNLRTVVAEISAIDTSTMVKPMCPMCKCYAFTERLVRTGYLNNSNVFHCTNCDWEQVGRTTGRGGDALRRSVDTHQKEFLQALKQTGSIDLVTSELKRLQAERHRKLNELGRTQTVPNPKIAAPRTRKQPAAPPPEPPTRAQSHKLVTRAQNAAPVGPCLNGCQQCGNTHPRHETDSNQCRASLTWRKINAGEWLKRSTQSGYDKTIANAWPKQHQHKLITVVYARAKAGRSIVLTPAGHDPTAALTRARVRLWCAQHRGATPAEAFHALYPDG